MLRLSKMQSEHLQKLETEFFRGELVEHVRRCFPRRCTGAGDEAVLQAIRDGIALAARHGIKEKRDICRLVDMVLVLGPDFDRDPLRPWAGRILTRSQLGSARVDALWDAVVSQVRQPSGRA